MADIKAQKSISDDEIKTTWRRNGIGAGAAMNADPDGTDADGDDSDTTDSDSDTQDK